MQLMTQVAHLLHPWALAATPFETGGSPLLPLRFSLVAKLSSSSSTAKFDDSNGSKRAFMARGFAPALSPPESMEKPRPPPPYPAPLPQPQAGLPSRDSCPYPSSWAEFFPLDTPTQKLEVSYVLGGSGGHYVTWGSLHTTPLVKILTHKENLTSFCVFLFSSIFELFTFSHKDLFYLNAFTFAQIAT